MKMRFGVYVLISSVFGIICLQACSSLQTVSNNKIYTENFNAVNECVEKGIRIADLAIFDVIESRDPVTITYRIGSGTKARGSSDSPVGAHSVQHEEGKVTVRNIVDGQVQVSVENPDYNFTVPSHEKEDYRQRLFQVLEQMNQNKAKS